MLTVLIWDQIRLIIIFIMKYVFERPRLIWDHVTAHNKHPLVWSTPLHSIRLDFISCSKGVGKFVCLIIIKGKVHTLSECYVYIFLSFSYGVFAFLKLGDVDFGFGAICALEPDLSCADPCYYDPKRNTRKQGDHFNWNVFASKAKAKTDAVLCLLLYWLCWAVVIDF